MISYIKLLFPYTHSTINEVVHPVKVPEICWKCSYHTVRKHQNVTIIHFNFYFNLQKVDLVVRFHIDFSSCHLEFFIEGMESTFKLNIFVIEHILIFFSEMHFNGKTTQK